VSVQWMWHPGLRVAHALHNGHPLCREVTGTYAFPWTPSDKPHCQTCTRRLPKPLTWITHGRRTWPDCDACISQFAQPGMVEAIHSVSIEHPVNVKAMIEHYHEGGHRDE